MDRLQFEKVLISLLISIQQSVTVLCELSVYTSYKSTPAVLLVAILYAH
jgi:hypothetical protein